VQQENQAILAPQTQAPSSIHPILIWRDVLVPLFVVDKEDNQVHTGYGIVVHTGSGIIPAVCHFLSWTEKWNCCREWRENIANFLFLACLLSTLLLSRKSSSDFQDFQDHCLHIIKETSM